jgi:hypothetical protein
MITETADGTEIDAGKPAASTPEPAAAGRAQAGPQA